MRKIVFVLSLTLITFSLPIVNADADISCSTSINMLKPNNFINGIYRPFDYSPSDIGYASYSYNGLIPVEPSTKYHYENDFNSTGTFRVAIVYYDEDFEYLSYTNTKASTAKYYYTFTTLENAYYITLHLYQTSLSTLNSSKYQLQKGSSITEFVDYVECPVVEPEPEPLPADTTLDGFYSIYVSKLKELSDYVIENKFLLGTFGVILSFIVLEIILNLFRNGGYR